MTVPWPSRSLASGVVWKDSTLRSSRSSLSFFILRSVLGRSSGKGLEAHGATNLQWECHRVEELRLLSTFLRSLRLQLATEVCADEAQEVRRATRRTGRATTAAVTAEAARRTGATAAAAASVATGIAAGTTAGVAAGAATSQTGAFLTEGEVLGDVADDGALAFFLGFRSRLEGFNLQII